MLERTFFSFIECSLVATWLWLLKKDFSFFSRTSEKGRERDPMCPCFYKAYKTLSSLAIGDSSSFFTLKMQLKSWATEKNYIYIYIYRLCMSQLIVLGVFFFLNIFSVTESPLFYSPNPQSIRINTQRTMVALKARSIYLNPPFPLSRHSEYAARR